MMLIAFPVSVSVLIKMQTRQDRCSRSAVSVVTTRYAYWFVAVLAESTGYSARNMISGFAEGNAQAMDNLQQVKELVSYYIIKESAQERTILQITKNQTTR